MTVYVFSSYPALQHMAKHINLKNNPGFNRVMFEHYEALQNSYQKQGSWMKAYFAGRRKDHYKEKMEQLGVLEMLKDINKNKLPPITIHS